MRLFSGHYTMHFYNVRIIVSAPFRCNQKIADIPMFNAIAAHIKFIKGDNIFWEVVADAVK